MYLTVLVYYHRMAWYGLPLANADIHNFPPDLIIAKLNLPVSVAQSIVTKCLRVDWLWRSSFQEVSGRNNPQPPLPPAAGLSREKPPLSLRRLFPPPPPPPSCLPLLQRSPPLSSSNNFLVLMLSGKSWTEFKIIWWSVWQMCLSMFL